MVKLKVSPEIKWHETSATAVTSKGKKRAIINYSNISEITNENTEASAAESLSHMGMKAALLKPVHLHSALTACVARTTERYHIPILDMRGV